MHGEKTYSVIWGAEKVENGTRIHGKC